MGTWKSRHGPLKRYYKRGLRLTWAARTHKGFFLRAEDFFGLVKRLDATREALERDLAEVQADYRGRSAHALALAQSPLRRELAELQRRYGAGLDVLSHGEAFWGFFAARLVPDGLYLLDEPETPLSPARQLALLAQIDAMVGQRCQFLIATHSPLLMVLPGATIFSFDHTPPRPVAWGDVEHVTLTRAFLNNLARFLHHLRG